MSFWMLSSRLLIFLLLSEIICYTSSRFLNKRSNNDNLEDLDSDDLLENPGLLEKLTKSQLQDLLDDIDRKEIETSSNASEANADQNPFKAFDEVVLEDLFSQGSSKDDLEALSDLLNHYDDADDDNIGKQNEGNSTLDGLNSANSQTQSQSQNVSIITNIYNQGAGGQHHHQHYHLLLLSDDGQAQEIPLESILNSLTSPSSPSSTTTIEDNDIINDNSITQNITINDIIQALTIIKNGNATSASVTCPPNSASTSSNGVNPGSSVTTPSSFYEPPPADENEGSHGEVENSATHDPNTDDIHLTTAFPTPSTSSSSISGLNEEQNSLLPPVVIPPQTTNNDIKLDNDPNSANENLVEENINIDSLTVKSVYTCGSVSDGATTNFVNPSYPKSDTTADGSRVTNNICTFLLKIPSGNEDICQVRVDFVDTNMLQPIDGECARQYLTIRGTIWPMGVTKFCGINRDQHFYIEIDQAHSVKYVEFVVVTVGEALLETGNFEISDYNWGLWITQLPCDGSRLLTAPTGCFQYFLESSGSLTSYNFQGGQYLNNQAYRICILSARGACKVKYHGEGDSSFGLDKFGNYKTSPYWRSGVSSLYCLRDYLRIPDGSTSGYGNTITRDRYCGGRLNPNHNARSTATVSSPIYGRVITLDFRSGDPLKFPTRYQNGANDPAALNGFSGVNSKSFNKDHHTPGYSIRYEQYMGDECKSVDLSLIGEYDNLT